MSQLEKEHNEKTIARLRELSKELSSMGIWNVVEGSREHEALDKARKAVNVARHHLIERTRTEY